MARSVGDWRKPKELRQENREMRALARDAMWPRLVADCVTIQKANQFLKFCEFMLDNSFEEAMTKEQARLSALKLSEFPMNEVALGDQYVAERAFLFDMLRDKPVGTVKVMLEQMKGALASFVNDELRDRRLDSLKTNFLE